MPIYYGCELSPSLRIAKKKIIEPCEEVHECVLKFSAEPSDATKAILQQCGFERLSELFTDELLS